MREGLEVGYDGGNLIKALEILKTWRVDIDNAIEEGELYYEDIAKARPPAASATTAAEKAALKLTALLVVLIPNK